jgi:hypothetical protein
MLGNACRGMPLTMLSLSSVKDLLGFCPDSLIEREGRVGVAVRGFGRSGRASSAGGDCSSLNSYGLLVCPTSHPIRKMLSTVMIAKGFTQANIDRPGGLVKRALYGFTISRTLDWGE